MQAPTLCMSLKPGQTRNLDLSSPAIKKPLSWYRQQLCLLHMTTPMVWSPLHKDLHTPKGLIATVDSTLGRGVPGARPWAYPIKNQQHSPMDRVELESGWTLLISSHNWSCLSPGSYVRIPIGFSKLRHACALAIVVTTE